MQNSNERRESKVKFSGIIGNFIGNSCIRLAIHVFGFFIFSAHVAAAPPLKSQPQKAQLIAWDRLQEAADDLRLRESAMKNDHRLLDSQDLDRLEGWANDAVISHLIKAVYVEASLLKWTQTQSFRIFSLENLLSNSANEIPTTFSTTGFRVAVFALRNARLQRGVLLTTSFRSKNPTELRDMYRHGSLIPLLEASDQDFRKIAIEILERFRSDDSRKSRHVQVIGNASAWLAGCELSIGGKFCINASLFDAIDTDPTIFSSALSGTPDVNPIVENIRREKLAWPIERTYISRGYKTCACGGRHFGLDLTAPVGTPVHSVGRGTVLHAKQFSGWGNAVVIEHTLPDGGKFVSLYAHLSKFRSGLKVGDSVARGELLALSGKSGSSAAGNSIPPHLHLEIRNAPEGKEPLQQPRTQNDRPIDPLRVLDIFNIFVSGPEDT